MTLDVAAARAAVNQAALVRDEEELRRIADSLPPLTAFGYERHRARAFANAIRGARDSAVGELCLGVAACPPAASTFVADSAQLRLLGGEHLQPAPAPARTPLFRRIDARVVASAAALAAAVTALAVLPGETLDRGRPEAAGVTAPAAQADPRVVPGEPQVFEPPAVGGRGAGESAAEAPTLVSALPGPQLSTAEGTAAALDDSAAPATSRRAPSPRAPTPAPPAPPRPPTAAPTSPPPAAPSAPAAPPPPAASAPASTATPAVAPAKEPAAPAPATRERGGKALGHAHAPGQLKDESTPATAFAPPTPAAPASPSGDPGQGNGDPPGKRP